MKKSILKRALAAAVAVPVALTQTLLCASFAADTTTEDAAAETIGTLDIATFMDVEADPSKNVPVEVSKTETTREYKQISAWNQGLYGILNSVAGTVVELDVKSLAENITSTAWYAEALKAAMTGDASATMAINSDDVVITINTNYNYAADVQKALSEKLGDITVDLGNATAAGQIVLTVKTADLMNSKTVNADAVITVDGQEKDAEGLLAYAQSKLTEVRTAAEKAAAGDAEMAQAVADLFDSYQSKLDAANEKYDAAMAKSKSVNYAGESYDAVLAQVKADNAGTVADRLPDSIGAVIEKATIVKMFEDAVSQLDAAFADKGYAVEMTAQDVVDLATGMYDVTVEANVNAGTVKGGTTAYTADTADTAALYAYFEDIEADNNRIIENFKTELYVEVTANGSVEAMDGDVTFDVTRKITYDVVDPATTTTDTTATETETTATETSDSDDGSGTTATETDVTDDGSSDDGSGTTATETDVTDDGSSDDGSSTTATETDVTDDGSSDDGSSTTATETSDSDDGSSDDGSGTTTTETGVSDDGSSTSTETTESTVETEVVKTVTAAAKTDNFYFSHDDTALTAEMLLESAELVVTTDGVAADPVDVMANISFGVTEAEPDAGLTPEMIYNEWNEAYAAIPIYAFYTDPDDVDAGPVLLDVDIQIYVGVKGDGNLDGAADAKDAAAVLMFAASVGAGNLDATLHEEGADVENFAFFLADVNTELKDHTVTELDAADAALILAYAAWYGGLDETPVIGDIKTKWYEILNPIAE